MMASAQSTSATECYAAMEPLMTDLVQLDQPLPAEVLRRTSAGLAAYRNYPVFSWPWLRKRTLLVALGAGCFGALIGLMIWLTQHEVAPALSVLVYFNLGALALTTAGPFMATLVRQRRLEADLERRLVVAALVVGAVVSFGVDSWSSRRIGEAMRVSLVSPSTTGPPTDARAFALEHPVATLSNLVAVFVIYGLAGGGLAVRRYFTEGRRLAELAQERSLAELRAHQRELDTRLGLLQAQVEPHFLFNTLASVRSLIHTDPDLAQSTIDALVDYLRATIPRLRDDAGRVGSTLGQQTEICESYLKLMAVRMGGRLESAIDVEPGLRDASFPPLLLITLVENAIKHGIEPKRGPGRIAIRAVSEADGRMRVSVLDDGVGLRHGLVTGVGLSNVREWLKARYGERASFALTGQHDRGTEATVILPLEEV